MATNKTVRVVTGAHPAQYRSCSIISAATDNTFPIYAQTSADDRTFETIHDAGAPPVTGLKEVVVLGYSRGATGVTWNPADKTAAMTLSNGNLTAFSSDGSAVGTRSTTSHSSGKYYWEVTVNHDGGGFDVNIGVANGSASLVSANANNILCFNGNGQVWVAGSLTFNYGTAISNVGSPLQLALDAGNMLFWVRGDIGTQWNSNGTANPATGVGGQPVPAGAVFACCGMGVVAANGTLTANFGGTSYVNSPPAGFGNW